jgi:hypothetical protein
MHGTKCQHCSNKVPTCSIFVLGFKVVKLLITLNSSNCLRAHSVPNSIVMVHQPSTNVCHLIFIYWMTSRFPLCKVSSVQLSSSLSWTRLGFGCCSAMAMLVSGWTGVQPRLCCVKGCSPSTRFRARGFPLQQAKFGGKAVESCLIPPPLDKQSVHHCRYIFVGGHCSRWEIGGFTFSMLMLFGRCGTCMVQVRMSSTRAPW